MCSITRMARVVVSLRQQGAILGISANGRHVPWDGVDVCRLSDGKISNIWAGDDWAAILYDAGTCKAPRIPSVRECCRACAASKRLGWVAVFADDGTVTHESIRVTWHAPDELPEYRGGRFDVLRSASVTTLRSCRALTRPPANPRRLA